MNGYKCGGAIFKRYWSAAQRGDCGDTAQHTARRRRTERDDNVGLHDRALKVLPPAAAVDLVSVGPLMQPPLAAHLMLEVLDRIGNKHLLAGNAGICQRFVEQAPGRPHERMAGAVLLIARLLAHEHHRCALWPLARYRLGRVLVERTALANVLFRTQRRERLHDRTIVVIKICPAFLHRRTSRFVPASILLGARRRDRTLADPPALVPAHRSECSQPRAL